MDGRKFRSHIDGMGTGPGYIELNGIQPGMPVGIVNGISQTTVPAVVRIDDNQIVHTDNGLRKLGGVSIQVGGGGCEQLCIVTRDWKSGFKQSIPQSIGENRVRTQVVFTLTIS